MSLSLFWQGEVKSLLVEAKGKVARVLTCFLRSVQLTGWPRTCATRAPASVSLVPLSLFFQLLLDNGGDLRNTTMSGMNPLMCAVQQRWHSVSPTIQHEYIQQ